MKLLIYGAGNSALSALKAVGAADVLITDREANSDIVNVIFALNGRVKTTSTITVDELYQYDYIVRSPGISRFDKLLRRMYELNLPVISEIELGYMLAPQAKYIAITGTNGKTTTASLLYKMLSLQYQNVFVAGNIGIPLTSIAHRLDENSIVVLEVSSFQLEDIRHFAPTMATITNLAPNHLDASGNIDFYYQSKMQVIKNLQGFFFLNNNDEMIKKLLPHPLKIITFGDATSTAAIKDGLYINGECIIKDNQVKLIGNHNWQNICLAGAMAYALKVERKNIAKAIKEFQLPRFRLQLIKEAHGISFYNDSKSTTPEATTAALEALKGKNVILLLGGKDKGISYEILKNYPVMTIAFGQIGPTVANTLNCEYRETMEQALELALSIAKTGDCILLSPGASSYDQFKDYRQRGQAFDDLVDKI